MKEADVALTPIPQAKKPGFLDKSMSLTDMLNKNPVSEVVLLRELPPYQDFLVCGISTQLHQEVVGFDDVISPDDSDFIASGLRVKSLIRLGFLAVVSRNKVIGSIGSISSARHERLLTTLSNYLVSN